MTSSNGASTKLETELHDILVELGLEASVDGIDKQMYLKAKTAILQLFKESLPEKKELNYKMTEETPVQAWNAAIDQMKANLSLDKLGEV